MLLTRDIDTDSRSSYITSFTSSLFGAPVLSADPSNSSRMRVLANSSHWGRSYSSQHEPTRMFTAAETLSTVVLPHHMAAQQIWTPTACKMDSAPSSTPSRPKAKRNPSWRKPVPQYIPTPQPSPLFPPQALPSQEATPSDGNGITVASINPAAIDVKTENAAFSLPTIRRKPVDRSVRSSTATVQPPLLQNVSDNSILSPPMRRPVPGAIDLKANEVSFNPTPSRHKTIHRASRSSTVPIQHAPPRSSSNNSVSSPPIRKPVATWPVAPPQPSLPLSKSSTPTTSPSSSTLASSSTAAYSSKRSLKSLDSRPVLISSPLPSSFRSFRNEQNLTPSEVSVKQLETKSPVPLIVANAAEGDTTDDEEENEDSDNEEGEVREAIYITNLWAENADRTEIKSRRENADNHYISVSDDPPNYDIHEIKSGNEVPQVYNLGGQHGDYQIPAGIPHNNSQTNVELPRSPRPLPVALPLTNMSRSSSPAPWRSLPAAASKRSLLYEETYRPPTPPLPAHYKKKRSDEMFPQDDATTAAVAAMAALPWNEGRALHAIYPDAVPPQSRDSASRAPVAIATPQRAILAPSSSYRERDLPRPPSQSSSSSSEAIQTSMPQPPTELRQRKTTHVRIESRESEVSSSFRTTGFSLNTPTDTDISSWSRFSALELVSLSDAEPDSGSPVIPLSSLAFIPQTACARMNPIRSRGSVLASNHSVMAKEVNKERGSGRGRQSSIKPDPATRNSDMPLLGRMSPRPEAVMAAPSPFRSRTHSAPVEANAMGYYGGTSTTVRIQQRRYHHHHTVSEDKHSTDSDPVTRLAKGHGMRAAVVASRSQSMPLRGATANRQHRGGRRGGGFWQHVESLARTMMERLRHFVSPSPM